jgi:LETM1 and EF-hand domain-containing protein 1
MINAYRIIQFDLRMLSAMPAHASIDEIRAKLDTVKAQKKVIINEESMLKEELANALEIFEAQQPKQVVEVEATPVLAAGVLDEAKPKEKKAAKAVVVKTKSYQARAVAMWKHFKAEMYSYWLGTKLLYADTTTAWGLFKLVLRGKSLTRREYRQFVRTGSDLIRIVPTLAFIVIPGAELLLPVALYLFPDMLPSTFSNEKQKEEKRKKTLTARVAVAGFLQDAVRDVAKQVKPEGGQDAVSVDSLLSFLDRARNGQDVSSEEILRIAPLFRDELTLDTMSRPLLVNMCKLMGLSSFGADALLRYQLRSQVRAIRNDDKDIRFEGIDSLSLEELKQACCDRGMRSEGDLTKEQYKAELQEWIMLSGQKKMPTVLLVLSRSFKFSKIEAEKAKDAEAAKARGGMFAFLSSEAKPAPSSPDQMDITQLEALADTITSLNKEVTVQVQATETVVKKAKKEKKEKKEKKKEKKEQEQEQEVMKVADVARAATEAAPVTVAVTAVVENMKGEEKQKKKEEKEVEDDEEETEETEEEEEEEEETTADKLSALDEKIAKQEAMLAALEHQNKLIDEEKEEEEKKRLAAQAKAEAKAEAKVQAEAAIEEEAKAGAEAALVEQEQLELEQKRVQEGMKGFDVHEAVEADVAAAKHAEGDTSGASSEEKRKKKKKEEEEEEKEEEEEELSTLDKLSALDQQIAKQEAMLAAVEAEEEEKDVSLTVQELEALEMMMASSSVVEQEGEYIDAIKKSVEEVQGKQTSHEEEGAGVEADKGKQEKAKGVEGDYDSDEEPAERTSDEKLLERLEEKMMKMVERLEDEKSQVKTHRQCTDA